MKPMLTKSKWILRIALAGLLAIFIASLVVFQVDYSEYNAFRRAIKSEGFEIQKRWIYEEDFVLEDFGIYADKAGFGFWLDVRHLSDVRSPDAKIEGILLKSLHDESRDNERIIAFDSSFWREEKLPLVRTPREFLAQVEAILPSVYKSK